MLFLAVRGAHWSEMARSLRQARFEWLAAGIAVAYAALLLRALRWRVLLLAGSPVSAPTVFWAASIGYLGNFVLPARLGEVLRSGAISVSTGLSLGYVLATAMTERVMDAGVLVVVLSQGLAGVGGLPPWVPRALKGMSIAALAGVALVAAAPALGGLPAKLLDRSPLPERLRGRVAAILEDVLLGIRALHHWAAALAFFGLTAAVWACDAAVAILVASALGLHLSVPGAIVFCGSLGLSSAIPSAPGFIGMFQFVAVTVLPPFGIARDQALLFSLAMHAVNYAVFVSCGVAGLFRLRLRITRSGAVLKRQAG